MFMNVLRSAPGRKRLNLALLVASFGIGQGAIFLAQTYLVARDELALLAAFGTHFSFAVFAILVVDLGAITVLARETAGSTGRGDARTHVSAAYWQITACRVAVAVVLALAAAGAALVYGDAFTRAYVLAALPGVLLWAFNAAGVLDGLRLSGISGLTGIPPYLASSIALLLAIGRDAQTAGFLLGAALCLGYVLALVGQILALAANGCGLKWMPPTPAGMRAAAQNGLAVLLTVLPGQVYFRIQLLLSTAILGAAATAIFIYAKQVITAFAQLLGFLRRVEFPELVARLASGQLHPIREILRTQRTGTLVAAVCAVLVGAIGLLVWLRLPAPASLAGFGIAIFAPTILSGALSLSFIQGLNALGFYRRAAAVMIGAVTLATTICAGFLAHAGIAVLAAADLAANLLAIALVAALLRARAKPAAPPG